MSSREELVRERLLAELSTLRERHDALRAQVGKLQGQRGLPDDSPVRRSKKNNTPLGQADRDAIEAFFNSSEDDFTKEFNEGQGRLQRTELLDGLTMPSRGG
ncbi:hypothetical protein C3747_13g2209c [Trypanosoma cruzi]|uniref:Uncharacterized protein n=2 Tax=Trypanosoma cruzi TaxID=5693 RepID=Q4CV68_TRYCC|nr:hypothetical protein, conserved [Trypanosoma cruzi]EAN84171.1 hypothetical protein, conserved [Trypanosoma cruzi]KAF8293216.1 hypothetical protein TcYC6_0111300 [Trypanosoma cruzi]PWV18424.1 hypothetical protein C3747_13g2209c [Trypanosoma cruzi]RNC50276.1 hypothetical protein TcCL_ESM12685 [Trypanosoma cruzi]|eukprot:XP_806022.1 hypothetical protein [Trypanosoma cruzi strain CL Brener]